MGNSFIFTDFLRGPNDGVNTVFFLTYTPNPPGSTGIRLDGLRLKQMFDYAVNGHAVTIVRPPLLNDVIVASYFYDA